jgi:hypothetical protein
MRCLVTKCLVDRTALPVEAIVLQGKDVRSVWYAIATPARTIVHHIGTKCRDCDGTAYASVWTSRKGRLRH